MGISFQNALDIHPAALQLRLKRTELLSANLANVDTPNFKAKDIDFSAEMQRTKFAFGQLASSAMGSSPEVMFRVPYQSSQDGNTVELNVEQAQFARNSLDFQTSLTFLNMKLNGLKKAIEGK